MHAGDEREITAQRFLATAQDGGIATFDRECRDIDADIWPRLVDHTEYTDRYAPAMPHQSVCQHTLVKAHRERIGQIDQRTYVVGECADARRIETQAIEHR